MAGEKEYVFLDVDDFDGPKKWMAICFLRALYPSRQILEVKEFYVDRTQDKILRPEKQAFWKQHDAALQYNLRKGVGISEMLAETELCSYVEQLRTNWPHFFLVSDNPGYDVAIVDHILMKHDHAPLSQRPGGRYAQTLCVWSYRLALTHSFNEKARSLFRCDAVQHVLQQYQIKTQQSTTPPTTHVSKPKTNTNEKKQQPSSTHSAPPRFSVLDFPPLSQSQGMLRLNAPSSLQKNGSKNYSQMTKNDHSGWVKLPHTVVYDCHSTMDMFFRCLDITNALHDPLSKKSILHEDDVFSHSSKHMHHESPAVPTPMTVVTYPIFTYPAFSALLVPSTSYFSTRQ